ncbi:hypothetical protein ACFL59_08845 [Planctomycetota bacterium]
MTQSNEHPFREAEEPYRIVDDRVSLLIAAGTAMAANSTPVLDEVLTDLVEARVPVDLIRGAVGIGQAVKERPATIMKEAADLLTGTTLLEQQRSGGCPAQGMKQGSDYKVVMLVAAGAAMGANCEPCLNKAVPALIEAGVADADIRRAVEIGQRVKDRTFALLQEAVDDVLAKRSFTGKHASANPAVGTDGPTSPAMSCTGTAGTVPVLPAPAAGPRRCRSALFTTGCTAPVRTVSG